MKWSRCLSIWRLNWRSRSVRPIPHTTCRSTMENSSVNAACSQAKVRGWQRQDVSSVKSERCRSCCNIFFHRQRRRLSAYVRAGRLILNPDRHYGNFGVLFDTETMQILLWHLYLTTTEACFRNWMKNSLRTQRVVYRKNADLALPQRFHCGNALGLLTDAIRSEFEKKSAGLQFSLALGY